MQFLTFTIANQHFALEASFVQRVVQAVEMICLPSFRAYICGAVNVHGDIIPVISMRRVFSFPSREMELKDKFIICSLDDVRVAFLVDDVVAVVNYEPEQLLPSEGMMFLQDNILYVVKEKEFNILICDGRKLWDLCSSHQLT